MDSNAIEKYLSTYGVSKRYPLFVSSVEGIANAIVIPVLAEFRSLFRTMASIAKNSAADLCDTLVICVVNNHPPPLTDESQIRENHETLAIIKKLASRDIPFHSYSQEIRDDLQSIAESRLRIAGIDASSPGLEIPERDGGVGMARKIGMDAALRIMNPGHSGSGIICCLDADTVVEKNYFSAVKAHFKRTGNPAAVTAYAHRMPSDARHLNAICSYEIFLRSYVIGLAYADSPYAFHSIGSTMAATTQGYVRVRGMNRRIAAEDFHFLNKLAKIGEIGVIEETTVYPSPRPSGRVPFGTGRQMLRILGGQRDECRLYDPRIFRILKEWLALMNADPDRCPEAILFDARSIHGILDEYLQRSRFITDWSSIRRNCSDVGHLRRQFHAWFDGLKTLRLVHHLSRSAFPLLPIRDGVTELAVLIGFPHPWATESIAALKSDDYLRILKVLRSCFPRS